MTGRICKHEGCGRSTRGRGMCNRHYMAWRRANPEILTVQQISDQIVMDALPGTLREVAARTGLHHETVSKVLKRLNVWQGRQVCIYDYRPPAVAGQHWTALWKMGGGRNYTLPTSRKRAHTKVVKDRTRPENKAKAAAGMIAPSPAASWLDILPVAA